MATATVSNQNETAPVHVSLETATYCLVKVGTKTVADLAEDGKTPITKEVDDVQFMAESTYEGAVEKAQKNGKTPPELLFKQSFTKPSANTIEGIKQLVPSEAEAVKLFNRGADNKLYQVIASRMKEQDENGVYVFQPVEGSIDLHKELAEETRSRATTPQAKVEKVLEGLSNEDALAIIAQLQAKLAAQSGAASLTA